MTLRRKLFLFVFPSGSQMRIMLRIVAIVVAVAAGYGFTLLMEEKKYAWAIIPALCILFASVLEFVIGDIFVENKYPSETQRRLKRLENQIGTATLQEISSQLQGTIEQLSPCDKTAVSATVHLLVEISPPPYRTRARALLQLVNYVGSESKGTGKGRVITLDQGVIGRCVRTGKRAVVNFLSLNEYRRRMVAEFGFTDLEARQHSGRGRSYVAEPLLNENTIVGVLYLYSHETQVFPLAAESGLLKNVAGQIVSLLRPLGVL